MLNFLTKEIERKLAMTIVLSLAVISVLTIALAYQSVSCEENYLSVVISRVWQKITAITTPPPQVSELSADIKKFTSESDFKEYLAKGASISSYYYGYGDGMMLARERGDTAKITAPSATPIPADSGAAGNAPDRVSGTNVQVVGIDEPDIVKTDGKEIYFSPTQQWVSWGRPLMETISVEGVSAFYPEYNNNEIKTIKAFPPVDLAIDGKIDKWGDLLLSNNILIVFSSPKIYGYDVSNPKAPEKKWEVELKNNTYVVGSRLYNGKIYLVTASTINSYRPCPIEPLVANGQSLEIKCGDIYHPITPVAVDTTFISLILNPASGKIEKKVSFVGSTASSLVYMSSGALYVTYPLEENIVTFYYNFLKEKGRDLIPGDVLRRLEKLEGYDISQQAKLMELETILEKYESSLDDDEQLKLKNELTNRIDSYYKAQKRELGKTGIVKIALDSFEVVASGSVPGNPLNQFSLDEYNGNLRIAVTIGDTWFGIIGSSSGESANDVYVLDKDLKTIGKVEDLGLGERIYSARFINDRGFLVTFKQTDPFYVLDLSNPRNPQLKGELKIPGYSSYLHPLGQNLILGVGQENWKVKISLFDVSSSENPTEVSKYTLDESWSEVLSTHHAFLQDAKHSIFFMPGGQGGYIFSYKGDELKMVKAISNISAKRALYINDYLYIVGDNKIVVINENDWTNVNSIEL